MSTLERPIQSALRTGAGKEASLAHQPVAGLTAVLPEASSVANLKSQFKAKRDKVGAGCLSTFINPFDDPRFTQEELSAPLPDLKRALRNCYVPYAQEMKAYGVAQGWDNPKIELEFKLTYFTTLKALQDLVLATVRYEGNRFSLLSDTSSHKPFEPGHPLYEDRANPLFENVAQMIIFYKRLSAFCNSQEISLASILKSDRTITIPNNCTIAWLSIALDQSIKNFQKYFDPNSKQYADLQIAELPTQGLIPLKDVELIARQALTGVFSVHELRTLSAQNIIDISATIRFCNPRGGKHFSLKELLSTVQLKHSLRSDVLHSEQDAILYIMQEAYPKSADRAPVFKNAQRLWPVAREARAGDEIILALHEIDYLRCELKSPAASTRSIREAVERVLYAVFEREREYFESNSTDSKPRALYTNIFSGTRLANSAGKVVFENIAQLLTSFPLMRRDSSSNGGNLAGLVSFYNVAEKFLDQNKRYNSKALAQSFGDKAYARIEKFEVIDAHLECLGELLSANSYWVKHFGEDLAWYNDQPDGALKNIAAERDLAQLAEAITTVMGALDRGKKSEVIDRLSQTVFMSYDGEQVVSGKELLQKADNHIRNWPGAYYVAGENESVDIIRNLHREFQRKQSESKQALEELAPDIKPGSSHFFDTFVSLTSPRRAPSAGEKVLEIPELNYLLLSIANQDQRYGFVESVFTHFLAAAYTRLAIEYPEKDLSKLSQEHAIGYQDGNVIFENIYHAVAVLKEWSIKVGGKVTPGVDLLRWAQVNGLKQLVSDPQSGVEFSDAVKSLNQVVHTSLKNRTADLPLDWLGKKTAALEFLKTTRLDFSVALMPESFAPSRRLLWTVTSESMPHERDSFKYLCLLTQQAIVVAMGAMPSDSDNAPIIDRLRELKFYSTNGEQISGTDLLAHLGSYVSTSTTPEAVRWSAVQTVRDIWGKNAGDVSSDLNSKPSTQKSVHEVLLELLPDVGRVELIKNVVCPKELVTLLNVAKFPIDFDVDSSAENSWNRLEKEFKKLLVSSFVELAKKHPECMPDQLAANFPIGISKVEVVFESINHAIATWKHLSTRFVESDRVIRHSGSMYLFSARIDACRILCPSASTNNASKQVAALVELPLSSEKMEFCDIELQKQVNRTDISGNALKIFSALDRIVPKQVKRSERQEFAERCLFVCQEIVSAMGSLHSGTPELVIERMNGLTFYLADGRAYNWNAEIFNIGMMLGVNHHKDGDSAVKVVNYVRDLFKGVSNLLFFDNSHEKINLSPAIGEVQKLLVGLQQNARPASPSEDVVSLSTVDKLLALQILDAQAFLEEYKKQGIDPKFQLVTMRYIEDVQYKAQVVAGEVVEAFLNNRQIGEREVFTYEWPNVRIANSEGQVVFENFGQLVHFISILDGSLVTQVCKLARRYPDKSLTAGHFRVESPLELIAQFRDLNTSDIQHYERLLARFGEDKTNWPDLDLPPIKDSDIDSILSGANATHIMSRAIPTADSDPINNRRLYVTYLLEAKHLIEQVMGSLENGSIQQVQKELKDLKVYSCTAKKVLLASEVLIAVGVRSFATENVKSRRLITQAIQEVRSVFLVSKDEQQKDPISVIPAELHIPAGTLFLALCALNQQENTAKQFAQFEAQLHKIQAKQPKELPKSTQSPVLLFQEVLESSLASIDQIDLTAISTHYLTELLHQICIRTYDGDLQQVINELEKHRLPNLEGVSESRKEILTHIFAEVIPALETRYHEQTTRATPDSIKLKPYGHQRAAAIAAAFLERPILVMEPGTGKTLSLALTVEMLGAKGALWITKTAAREQTFTDISTNILNASCVIELTSELVHGQLSDFKAVLERADYIVAGYDSIRILKETKPEHFEALNTWLSERVRILDEAHLIDKRTSGRSKAVCALNTATHTFVSSGTPYQHKDARVATLLSIALPDKFPNPDVLEQLFESDPNAARITLHAHSTVLSLEDVSLPFEDPSKISFAEQLRGGIPRVPQLVSHRVAYSLSPEHTLVYADLMLNFKQWAEANNHEQSGNRRAILTRRLVSFPERLNLSGPQAMINAVKEIAVPVLERGEKVLVLSFNKHPLHLLAADPEIQSFGAVALDGDQSTSMRTKLVRKLEDDPDTMIGLGQVSAVGTGFNIRSIACVIVLDRPLQSSELCQALGRPIRLLGPGDERFARQTVQAHFLEAVLDAETIAELPEKERVALSQETVYQKLLSASLKDLQRQRSYVVRGESATAARTSIETILDRLEKNHSTVLKQANGRSLFSADRAQLRTNSMQRYNTAAKNRWRTEELGAFVEQQVPYLSCPVEEAKVVVLAGPEGLEIPIYLEQGFKASNIHVFEGSRDRQWLSAVRETARKFGSPFYASSVEKLLPHMHEKFDLVSIDPDGYTTPALALMFAQLDLNDSAIILKNTLAAREQGAAKELIIESQGRRELLDLQLIKLVGSKSASECQDITAIELLRIASKARAFARLYAPIIQESFDLPSNLVQECICDLVLRSRHTTSLSQGRYITPGGSPFQYTFAAVKVWNPEILNMQLVLELQKDFSRFNSLSTASARLSIPELTRNFYHLLSRDGAQLLSYYSGVSANNLVISSHF